MVARWRASSDTNFDNSILKINGGEVASISKQALFEPYESKSHWWRGGEPGQTQALTNQSWKSLVARWRANPNRLWKIILKNHLWRGGEHIQKGSLWIIRIKKSWVARWRAISDTYFDKSVLKITWWRGGESFLKTVLTHQSWKSLVARWRAYPNRLFLMNMNSKFPCGEVASHCWH